MTAQELQSEQNASAATEEALRADAARQEEIFREREDELLARYPDKFIVMCAGEVFVGDSDGEALDRAEAVHPDRAVFMRMYGPFFIHAQNPAGSADVEPAEEALRADAARQKEIFREREDELLARYPDKFIVVCAGEVFVGDSEDEALSRAEAVHPDRATFMRTCDPALR